MRSIAREGGEGKVESVLLILRKEAISPMIKGMESEQEMVVVGVRDKN